jgi:ubiquinone/menaquinone biosynthesis C-methylase UbiE
MSLQMMPIAAYYQHTDDPIKFYRTPVFGRLYRRRVARCLELLPPGQRVLEIGYGSGVSFLNLAQKFDQIHGIDLHDHADDVAHSFASSNLDLHLRRGNVLNLPFADATFDSAVAISIHEHLQPAEQRQAFGEVRRVLKPGGSYVVGVPGMNLLMTVGLRMLGCDIHQTHFSSETQVLAAMRDHFDVDATRYQRLCGLKRCTMYLSMRGRKPVDSNA